MNTDKYIGQSKVVEKKDKDGMVTYSLTNGLKAEVTAEQWQSMVSDEPYDEGQISLRKWRSIIELIIKIMMDNNAQFKDVGWLLDRVSETVTENANLATAKLLKVDSKEFVSLKRIDEVLRSE